MKTRQAKKIIKRLVGASFKRNLYRTPTVNEAFYIIGRQAPRYQTPMCINGFKCYTWAETMIHHWPRVST